MYTQNDLTEAIKILKNNKQKEILEVLNNLKDESKKENLIKQI